MSQTRWRTLREQPQLWQVLWQREKIIDGIRRYFKTESFHEVDTPLLVPSPSTEPYLEFFKTWVKYQDGSQYPAFLTSSPEFAMKKMLVAGSGNIFQICKSFRNVEGRSGRHNPEFTILEWYRTTGDYTHIMSDFEGLMLYLLRDVSGNPTATVLEYQGISYDLSAPWERLTLTQAFQRYVGVDTDTLLDRDKLVAVAGAKGYQTDGSTTWEQAYNQLLLNEIEPHLGVGRPTILCDYPASQAALSRKKPEDPRFAERFEVYLAGVELGNAFTELTDAEEQEARCRADLEERKALGKEEFPLDEEFIEALRMGMPPTGGIAVGVDRLIMLLTNQPDIQHTVAFPADELFPARE